MDNKAVEIKKSWRLNERHYGALQGRIKKKVVEEEGEETVFAWRRGFDTPPPALDATDERNPSKDALYADLDPKDIPLTESLKDTIARVMPYWESEIAYSLQAGKHIIIAAHGNSLRALVKYLDGISDKGISKINIPTGIPLVYELDDDLRPIKHYYLGDPLAAKKAADAVKSQA